MVDVSPKQLTLCFLLRTDEVLLAMKKRGVGAGKWNGSGGKVEAGETIRQAAIRETQEELGVTPRNLKQVGFFDFHHPAFNHVQVSVFTSTSWDGEPTESEEMAPKWFKISEIRYKEMWADDVYWLPLVLEGKQVQGTFRFNDKGEILEHNLAST